MRRWSIWVASVLGTGELFAADPLPVQDPAEGLDVEPPLLIGNRAADGTLVVAPPGAATPVEVDLAKLESDLARAKRNAASGERLFKMGVIAKVDAEERALKVVRLEAKLADAKLAAAKQQAESANESDSTARTETKPDAVAAAEAEAQRATEQRQHAELEAALRNLQRQQKLLALGSGRKADVNRAEKKLAELQKPGN
jgi:hypothetical protein